MNETEARKWETQRHIGAPTWIATRGTLGYGLALFIPMLYGRWPIVLPRDATLLAFLIALALGLGSLWGLSMWALRESQYRKYRAATAPPQEGRDG